MFHFSRREETKRSSRHQTVCLVGRKVPTSAHQLTRGCSPRGPLAGSTPDLGGHRGSPRPAPRTTGRLSRSHPLTLRSSSVPTTRRSTSSTPPTAENQDH